MKDLVRVVILDELDRVLMMYERKNGWVLPGGKIEPNETPLNALKRNVLEEVGIEIKASHTRITYHQNRDGVFKCFWFWAESFTGEPRIKDPEKYLEMRFMRTGELMVLEEYQETLRSVVVARSLKRHEEDMGIK